MKGPVEFWKKHPDIEGIEVSSFGRVRSSQGHYYTNCRDKDGYMLVGFGMNGKCVTKRVHRLVAQTFIPNPNNLPQINHKDGSRANNNASNIEWCTSSYNCQYREKFGKPSKKSIFAINLTTLEASWLLSQHEAGRVLGVDQSTVSKVIKGSKKQTGGYWFVNADDSAVNITKRKLHDIGETGLKVKQTEDTMSTNKASKFVRQVLAAYALERKLAYGKQKLA
ncbi:HNH endonuclease [Lactiplantibacillus pentosus]|uniref:HNH endonuclease n=1 Tax=Lactiplantibacillus pentosus TaxID=1589 RepID=UPI003F53BD19